MIVTALIKIILNYSVAKRQTCTISPPAIITELYRGVQHSDWWTGLVNDGADG